MERLAFAVALAFAVLGGGVAVSAVAANPAYADGGGNGEPTIAGDPDGALSLGRASLQRAKQA
jgi:hypothetical protein